MAEDDHEETAPVLIWRNIDSKLLAALLVTTARMRRDREAVQSRGKGAIRHVRT